MKSAGSYIAEGVNTGSGNVPRNNPEHSIQFNETKLTIMHLMTLVFLLSVEHLVVIVQMETWEAFIDQGFQPISLEGQMNLPHHECCI